jgi:hypothetical protein
VVFTELEEVELELREEIHLVVHQVMVEQDLQIQFQDVRLLTQVEEVEVMILVLVEQDQVDQVEEELERLQVLLEELQEQIIPEVEVEVEVGIQEQLLQEDQEDRVLSLLDHQDQQDLLFLYHQVQIQKQHYRHQLEDVLLQHLQCLEH